MSQQNLQGVALGIVKGNKTVHLSGFGHADANGRPATARTPFYIGSVSKSFTALAVMQLVEAGKVELDQPVRKYIPWFQVGDPAASGKITVASLLNHTSGLPAWEGYWWKEDSSASALENGVRSMRTLRPAYPPGQRWGYSSVNFTILGLLVQTVSGQSYESYVQERILTPLDMTNTHLSVPAAKAAGLATEHRFWFNRPFAGGGLPYNRAITPAGLIMSDAQDMSHYLIAQLNGGRYGGAQVLSEAGIDQLHQGTAAFGGAGDTYGMGWMASTGIDGSPFAWHAGDTGGSVSYMSVMPQTGWGVIYLTNGFNDLAPNARYVIPRGVTTRLLMGHQPDPVPGFLEEEFALALMVLLGVGLLQVAGIARSLLLWRRWSRHPGLRPHGIGPLALRVVAPLTLNLVWAGFCLVAVPTVIAKQPLAALINPPSDWAMAVLTLGGVALIWGVVLRPLGTVLLLRKPFDPIESSILMTTHQPPRQEAGSL